MIPSRVLLVLVSFWASGIAGANAAERDAVSLRIRHSFECASNAQIAFSPDGESLAVATADYVEIWDVVSGKKPRSLGVRKQNEPWYINTNSVTFSRDGKFLATGGRRGIVTVWDVVEGKVRHEIRAHVVVVDELHVIKRDGKVVKNLKETRDDPSSIVSVAFSPDGKTVAAASHDRRISISDVATGKVLKYLRADGNITALAFLADSNTLVTGSEGDRKNVIGIWDVAGGKRVAQLGDRRYILGITSLSVSGDGGLLVGTTGPTEFLPAPAIRLWDLQKRRQLKSIVPLRKDGCATRAALSPDGKYVASVGGLNRLVLWDVPRGARLAQLDLPQRDEGPELINVAFSPDGKTLAVMATEYTLLKDKVYSTNGRVLLIDISKP
ncbi:MAG: hypothetical protein IID44_28465 [Planctomycetes bacterium]|nr:hypothetical protein [Planctomycetota bacterium]